MSLQTLKDSSIYYGETNSHPLDADVFFVDVPSFTQQMELIGEEVYWFVCLFVCFFNTSMITRKKNILH